MSSSASGGGASMFDSLVSAVGILRACFFGALISPKNTPATKLTVTASATSTPRPYLRAVLSGAFGAAPGVVPVSIITVTIAKKGGCGQNAKKAEKMGSNALDIGPDGGQTAVQGFIAAVDD